MRKQVFAGRGSLLSRVAAVSLIGGLVAACSSETSRFSDNPFSNPFNGGAGNAQVASAPVAPQPGYAPASQPGGYGAPPAQPAQPYQPVASVGGGGWTANGGTPITVSQGDNLTSISNRYGVPANAILSANGLTSPSQVAAGSNIVIPIYSANAVAGSRMAAAPAPVVAPTRPVVQPPVQVASNTLNHATKAPANTLNNAKQVADAKIAATQKNTQSAIQKPLNQPVAVAKTQAAAAKTQVAQVKAAAPQKLQPPMQASVIEPPKTVAAAAPAPAPVQFAPRDAEQTASLQSSSQSNAEFRWPAKGRVISGFGSGGGNEGINIAVPEGTPVRATESGVVTFAGDDVKSYGNLVLIKHDNGYISAYAHNGSLNVKRGERVTRGQVIAKSGQTGDVTSPQLHFEIRKGQTPVDPVPYLGS